MAILPPKDSDITELIKTLQEIKAEHGNVVVTADIVCYPPGSSDDFYTLIDKSALYT